MFDHLLNVWMVSKKPVPKDASNRTGKARTIGWLPEEERTTEYWAPILEAREKMKQKDVDKPTAA